MGPAVDRHYEILDEVMAAHGGIRPVEQGEGDSVVAVFTRDVAETKAARATDAGKAAGFPLMFTTEPEE